MMNRRELFGVGLAVLLPRLGSENVPEDPHGDEYYVRRQGQWVQVPKSDIIFGDPVKYLTDASWIPNRPEPVFGVCVGWCRDLDEDLIIDDKNNFWGSSACDPMPHSFKSYLILRNVRIRPKRYRVELVL
jgi:hypothetical protein